MKIQYEYKSRILEGNIVEIETRDISDRFDPLFVSKQIINVGEQVKQAAIRQALVNLGWTPPNDHNN